MACAFPLSTCYDVWLICLNLSRVNKAVHANMNAVVEEVHLQSLQRYDAKQQDETFG